MKVAPVAPEVDFDAWLEWRRGGIGASDLPAIVGLSRWSSPLSIYMTKRGELPETSSTEAMRLGQLLEPVAAAVFTAETGIEVTGHQVPVEHDQDPWRRATIDAFTTADEVVEVKTTANLWNAVPDDVAVQVQWQLHVTDTPRGWVVQLATGRGWKIFDVAPDPQTIGLLIDAATDMWRRVNDGDPPDPTALDNDLLTARYGIHVPERAVDLGWDLVDRLAAARAAHRQAGEVRDETEAAIKAVLGDAEYGLVDGAPAVTWRTWPRRGYTVEAGTSRRLIVVDSFRRGGITNEET